MALFCSVTDLTQAGRRIGSHPSLLRPSSLRQRTYPMMIIMIWLECLLLTNVSISICIRTKKFLENLCICSLSTICQGHSGDERTAFTTFPLFYIYNNQWRIYILRGSMVKDFKYRINHIFFWRKGGHIFAHKSSSQYMPITPLTIHLPGVSMSVKL